MKKFLKYFLAVLILGTFFTGCKKDKTKPNYFSVADTTYSLSWGELIYWGPGPGYEGYGFWLDIYSNTITYDAGTDTWGGSGDFITFELASLLNTGIESGNYTFHLFDILPVFCYDQFSSWEVNWNSSPNESRIIIAGTLVVNNMGNNKYEFSFNGSDIDGNDVKAHFKGTLLYFDWSSPPKSTESTELPISRGRFIKDK